MGYGGRTINPGELESNQKYGQPIEPPHYTEEPEKIICHECHCILDEDEVEELGGIPYCKNCFDSLVEEYIESAMALEKKLGGKQ